MAEKQKFVGEDCLEFYDGVRKVAVNFVPLNRGMFIPRVGETMRLPGQGAGCSDGIYRVVGVEYLFAPDDKSEMPEEFGPAALYKVVVSVEKLR